ncbi:hypothetical protein HMN09_00996500 [Mycena chlorophos]|uniref:Uncharacterized protein n=1 Tax=Mycena chlorophos TaxID=658473 RepID=A0A8H6SKC0_MYCCL|nr:hypothetical protein HMN09_00996500 [Mycena chlorophos]
MDMVDIEEAEPFLNVIDPSALINDHLLAISNKDIHTAITHEDDWMGIINEKSFDSLEEFLEAVMNAHQIINDSDSGFVYLLEKSIYQQRLSSLFKGNTVLPVNQNTPDQSAYGVFFT